MKKICFLSSAHPPLDKRVFAKEATSLAASGFCVTHLCPGTKVDEYTVDGVKIITFPRRRGKLGRLATLPELYRKARLLSASAYHCNEPDSAVVGALLRITTGTRVVFDVHEHYPGQILRSVPFGTRAVSRVSTRVVIELLGLMMHMVVLAKPSVERDLALSRKRHLLILNATSVNYGGAVANRQPDGRENDAFTFVHLGVLRKERGSEQLLDAIAELRRRGRVDVSVRIIGEFEDGTEREFVRKAQSLGIADLIDLHDWMPFEDAYRLVEASDAGLVLFQRSLPNNVRGMPHKMFDYMVAGIPVIAPNFAADIAGVIGPSKAGLLVDTGDPVALAGAMEDLARDRELASSLGSNGRNAVVDSYSWEAEAAKLEAAYERLLDG
jgi:glycosyltransferase involved in cell wall biosynthesis